MSPPPAAHRIARGDPAQPDVAALLAAAEEHAHSLYPPEGVHMLDVSELSGPRVRFLVARSSEGRAQGCGAVVFDDQGAAELKRMFVAPDARGKGLGARLLRRLEDEARQAGARVLRLETGPLQAAALALYRRHGYRERGPFGDYREDPASSLFMEKELTAPKVPFAVPSSALRGRLVLFDGRKTREVAYRELAADVERARERLAATGLERGALVGLLGENCYEWLIHDLALQALGCLPVCFPADEFGARAPEELADGHELALLLVTRKLGNPAGLPWVVVMDAPEPTPARARPVAPRAGGLGACVEGTDACTVIFSSGTSGQLKALLLSRAGVDDTVDALARDWRMGPGDGILVALPLSIFQQRVMIYAALRSDTDILLSDPQNLFRGFKVLRPTIVLGPPALFETTEKRYHALPRFERAARTLAGRALAAVPGSARRARLRRRVFGWAHDAFGGRARALLTGSAPSKRSTLDFYELAGLPLFQAYGLAEVGFIAWNLPGRNRALSVGRPIVPGSVTLAEDGEILLALPHPQALGYFGLDPEEQARTFLPDGRIATGDIGRFDRDGFLYITGRKKSIILTQGGEKIQPEPLEAPLAVLPGVERAVVLGGGELPGLAALIAVDPGCDAEGEARVRAAVAAAVEALNAGARPAARITRFMLTRVAFRPESGLVTRNLKLDRRAVQRRFERELLDREAS